MKKIAAAVVALMATATAAHAAAPETVHAILQACALPCC